jgi:hypothetical protein
MLDTHSGLKNCAKMVTERVTIEARRPSSYRTVIGAFGR